MRRQDDFHEPQSEQFAKLLDGLTLWDKRIPLAVRGYFIDMSRVLTQLYRALQISGKCIIVVGNSAYGGVVIPTDSLLAKIAESIGFRIEKLAVARHLTTSSQQRASLGDRMEYLRESLLVLVKDAPGPGPQNLESIAEIPTEDHARHAKMFLIRNAGLTTGTHKFHRYPGKFIPHVPRWAINRFLGDREGKAVLDPFCGSGTTLVEASLSSIRSFGIDVDPIARLVSSVKTRPIQPMKLGKAVASLKAIISRSKVGEHRPTIPTLDHWFAKPAIRDLSKIRTAIERFREDKPIYEFFMVCFTAIIRRVSNADNQTQKTYVSHTKRKLPPAVLPLFNETLLDYSDRLSEFSALKGLGKVTIIKNTDARGFAEDWQTSNRQPIDLIISSPPYLNSVDYVYNQMAEYFWVGDLFGLETQPKQNEYKRNYVGTTKVDVRSYRNTPETSISEIDDLIQVIATRNLKNAYIVGRYFLDMIVHFKNAAAVLKPDAPYVCVVGDSSVSGETIPVHRFIADCARLAGFKYAGSFGYEIRNRHMRFPRMGKGGLVKYDWVIELRNGQR
jgi:DNA modification methylase